MTASTKEMLDALIKYYTDAKNFPVRPVPEEYAAKELAKKGSVPAKRIFDIVTAPETGTFGSLEPSHYAWRVIVSTVLDKDLQKALCYYWPIFLRHEQFDSKLRTGVEKKMRQQHAQGGRIVPDWFDAFFEETVALEPAAHVEEKEPSKLSRRNTLVAILERLVTIETKLDILLNHNGFNSL
jgi:hypothetical protein